MKKYIERYIYDVSRRLPKDMQVDVEKELSSNIYDMLGENPTEDEIDRVLHEIGSPRKIANNYKENKHYVISPLYYDDYLRVLKLVLIIVGVVMIVIGSIDSIINVNEATLFKTIVIIISSVVSKTFSALIGAFFWVTLSFWLIDYYQVKLHPNEWKIMDLPSLPEPKTTKIPRGQSIAGLVFHSIFASIFIVILLRYVTVLGWYENDVLVSTFFNKTITDKFIYVFIISAVITFIVQLLKIYYKEWNLNLAICYTASSIFSLILMLLFINHSNLISFSYFVKLADVMEVTVDYLKNGLKNIMIWVSVIASLLTVVDFISIWLKTLKPKQIK